MFSVHTTPEEFTNVVITGHFGSVIETYSVREIRQSLSKSCVFKMFSVHTKRKIRRFQIPRVCLSVFEKRDELVWTAGLTVEKRYSLEGIDQKALPPSVTFRDPLYKVIRYIW